MASDSQQSRPFPTAVHLNEPEFPSHRDPGESHNETFSHSSATDFAHATNAPNIPISFQAKPTEAKRPATPPVSTGNQEETSSRPSMQKSATERPQPSARRSMQEMKRAGTTQDVTHHMHRPQTMNFDPYYSDSDSSSSDEEDTQGTPLQGTWTNSGKTSKSSPFSKMKLSNHGFQTKGRVSKRDGRLKLSISETLNSGYFAKTLGAGLKKHFVGADDVQSIDSSAEGQQGAKIMPEEDLMEDPETRVCLNIVIIVIGSRGDIQPFLRIGKILKEDYGHRVRIATHPAFKNFVQDDSGLEFFSIGGDPSELMAFMVKNPGLIPNLETVKEGEIGRRRAAMYEMFQGMWRACINATDDESDHANLKMSMYWWCSVLGAGHILTENSGRP